MATETEVLMLRLEANMKRYEAALSRAQGNTNKAFGSIEARARAMEKTMAGVGRGIASIGVAIGASFGAGQLASGIFDTALQFERVHKAMVVATGSASAARAELDFVRQTAGVLGLELGSSAEQYAKLAAAARGTALEGQKTRDIFVGVATASSALGLTAADTAGVLNAVQQMISKGVVSAEELRGQMGERLPGAFQAAARSMNMTTAELGKQLELGNITADELLPKLAAELTKMGNAAGGQGAQAELNRLTNAWTDLKIAFADTGAVSIATGALQNLTGWLRLASSGIDFFRQRYQLYQEDLALGGGDADVGALRRGENERAGAAKKAAQAARIKKFFDGLPEADVLPPHIPQIDFSGDIGSKPRPSRARSGASRIGSGGAPEKRDGARDLIQSASAQVQALNIEAQALGMAEDAAVAYRFQQELLARAKAQDIPISSALATQIDALAQSYLEAQSKVDAANNAKKTDDFLSQIALRSNALAVEVQAMNMHGVERERWLIEQDLLTQARQQDIALTPDVLAGIEAEARARAELSDKLQRGTEKQRELAEGMRELQETGVQALEDLILNGKSFEDVLKGLVKQLASSALRNLLLGSSGGLAGGFGEFLKGIFGRASGGPVNAGQAYRVGETGPELFVPRSPGKIIRDRGGAGATSITIDLRGTTGDKALDQKLAMAVRTAVTISGSQMKRNFGTVLADHQLRYA